MTEWRKSSRCEANNCVEVDLSGVRVRNSQRPDVRLTFTTTAWRVFVANPPKKEQG